MSRAFEYRPKFVDIRVRPPTENEENGPEDVFTLKPGERACDHAGCRSAATARAPKSRDMLNEHYWFCAPHAAQYNKSWDFFAGMNEGQIRAAQEARATGERPTWAFRASPNAREAAAARARGVEDGFGLFGKDRDRARPVIDPNEARARKLGRLERNALADLDLDVDADAATIRARYTDLVKRCHPDSNGGDRSAEAKLQKVIRAYKVLRKASLA